MTKDSKDNKDNQDNQDNQDNSGKAACDNGADKCHSSDKRNKMMPGRPDDRDLELSRKDAQGGSPADVSVGGEEDAGVGLESLVRNNEQPHNNK